MSQLPQLVVNGLVTGAILAIAGVGVSLVYGVLRLVNFAHGDYLTFGAYVALAADAGARLGMPAATALAVLGTAALGLALEFALWRPLRRRRAGLLPTFVSAIGVALVLRQAILLAAGGDSRSFRVNAFTVHRFAGVRVSSSQLIAIGLAVAAIAVLGVFLARTRLGRSMRAYSANPELAAVAGVDVDRIVVYTWLIAGGLAGLAGVLQGLVQNAFDPNMGWSLLLPIFAAVVLGTIGSAYGALVGGFVLGLVMELSTWDVLGGGLPAVYKPVVAFVALALVLLVRPQGLFGRRLRTA